VVLQLLSSSCRRQSPFRPLLFRVQILASGERIVLWFQTGERHVLRFDAKGRVTRDTWDTHFDLLTGEWKHAEYEDLQKHLPNGRPKN
jgi:hypothetical protein